MQQGTETRSDATFQTRIERGKGGERRARGALITPPSIPFVSLSYAKGNILYRKVSALTKGKEDAKGGGRGISDDLPLSGCWNLPACLKLITEM